MSIAIKKRAYYLGRPQSQKVMVTRVNDQSLRPPNGSKPLVYIQTVHDACLDDAREQQLAYSLDLELWCIPHTTAS